MGLDFVEMVMAWEETFGIAIPDEEAENLRTVRQATDLIASKLNLPDGPSQPCLTLRAFHRLRKSITSTVCMPRDRVRPEIRLRDLLNTDRRSTWETVRASCGIASLPGIGWFSPRTVGDLMRWTVVHAAKELKSPGESWTRSEIRTVVRSVITEVTGVSDFDDDADFFREIGIG